ncbi:MAG: phosphotransferase [Lysobacterales bacterium]|jgi:hypothetical protein
MQDQRLRNAAKWAAGMLGRDRVEPRPVSGDASFRRYFRLDDGARTLILMDAPPDREDSAPFVDIAGRLRAAGVYAPEIVHFDLDSGFGLLEDLGDELYRGLVGPDTIDTLMPGLLDLLGTMARSVDAAGLPDYDASLLEPEMNLFTDWYLARHRDIVLDSSDRATWTGVREQLVRSALAQPQVFVHKDFHSCNLLATPSGPAVIDFQDAVRGPVSYDLASLLWDRYIPWPRKQLENWMAEARTLLAPDTDRTSWVRYCDWMGLQRNLKIVGIFARLNYRDGKQGYLELIPRFYSYLLDVSARYPELAGFHRLLERPECAP